MNPPMWFRDWQNAMNQANLYAVVTRRRYRVRYDAGNRWWGLTESVDPIGR